MKTYQTLRAKTAGEAVINALIIRTAPIWVPVAAITFLGAWIIKPSESDLKALQAKGKAGYEQCVSNWRTRWDKCYPRSYGLTTPELYEEGTNNIKSEPYSTWGIRGEANIEPSKLITEEEWRKARQVKILSISEEFDRLGFKRVKPESEPEPEPKWTASPVVAEDPICPGLRRKEDTFIEDASGLSLEINRKYQTKFGCKPRW